jgi:protoporphyrinogen oxidase
MISSTQSIPIIGAGLAGLSAAAHLGVPYTLYERQHTVGGIGGSFSCEGYTFDHAIHILYTKDPYAATFIRSLLGTNFRTFTRSSWIYSHGVYTGYPYQANFHGLPDHVIQQNIAGIRAVHARRSLQPYVTPANFRDWIYATFGEGIAANFMIPYNEKVWSHPLDAMSHQWCSSRVPVPDLASVERASSSMNSLSYGDNGEFWYPKHGGIGALSDALAARVERPRCDMELKALDVRNRRLLFANGEVKHYDVMISTLPLPTLVHMIPHVPEHVRSAAHALLSNKVVTINLGVDTPDLTDRHWVYFPEREFVFQRISFPATLSASMAPPGKSSITAEISLPKHSTVPMESLVAQCIEGLRRCGVLRSTDRVQVINTTVIDPAYVIYDHHHSDAVSCVRSYLRDQGIVTCGRFGEWEYLNIDHSLLSGRRAANEIMHQLSLD